MSTERRLARWRHLARITVELDSPLLIGTGLGAAFVDNTVVTDANDLPALPGTSLAGVLRAAWPGPQEEVDELFGHQRADEGRRSRVLVSWGAIHDQRDRPVSARCGPGVVEADEVLSDARALLLRDHVRLNHRGVVDGRGKYDRSAVRAGHRFTFEVEVEDATGGGEAELRALVDLLASPSVRMGGGTRNGLGAFSVKRALVRRFDLAEPADLRGYGGLPAELSEPAPGLEPMKISSAAAGVRTIKLKAAEPWVIGGGRVEDWEAPAGRGEDHRPPDLLPYKERRVEWPEGRGRLGPPVYTVPATAIKGALRHRTAFYLRVLQGSFVDAQAKGGESEHDLDPWGPHTLPELDTVFGAIHNEPLRAGERSGAEGRGIPGRVFISDARPKGARRRRSMHVSIDRFSGAPLAGHLFEDEALEGGTLSVQVGVDRRGLADDDPGFRAFERALRDLKDGLLNIGAGAGRGYGYFQEAP